MVEILTATCAIIWTLPSTSFAATSAQLVLNGEATRTVMGFEIYRVRLFLPTPSSAPSGILESKTDPKRLEIVLLRDVPSAKFISSVRKSVADNFTESERENFSLQLEKFMACFTSTTEIQSGTVVWLDFQPERGMVVTRGGREELTISAPDFYHAILRLWLGNPPQRSVKAGLLGLAG